MKLRNFRKLSVNEKHLKTIGLGLTVMYFFACGILENGVLDYIKYGRSDLRDDEEQFRLHDYQYDCFRR